MWRYYACIYSLTYRSENILFLMPGNKPSEIKKIKLLSGLARDRTQMWIDSTDWTQPKKNPLTVVLIFKLLCRCCWVASVVSDSVRPHRRQPTWLPRPWDSPSKNTGVGCHFLLQCRKVKSESEVAQTCLTQRPHGLQPTRLLRPWIFQARVLEWGAIAFSINCSRDS